MVDDEPGVNPWEPSIRETIRRRLDARRETAIGIAVTQAAGLKAMFGTDCKSFQVGRAASAGVLATPAVTRSCSGCRAAGTSPVFSARRRSAVQAEALVDRLTRYV